MWSLDEDPALRSSFMGITFLDQPPDPARLRKRMQEAIADNPVLLERVVQSPFDLATPRWEPDPGFDLDFHVRHVALPPPGSRRQLLDLAAVLYADPFDRNRPLWQFTVVEGLQDGGAALLAKMHHVISDGIGAVRLSVSFLDLGPDGNPQTRRPPPPPESPPPAGPRSWFDAAAGALAPLLSIPNVVRAPVEGVALGLSTVRSLARQLGLTDPARSPLWTQRSFAHRFDTVSIDLDETRAAAKALGGTVNDVYVTALAAAVGSYHREMGQPVEELRMAMPISVRHDREVGGNAWVPSRVLVPTGDRSPTDRFAEVHARLSAVRKEPSLGLTETFAGVVRHVPAPVLLRFARQQTGTVDFACSNVRGAPFDLWISGGHVLANHPMGPTAGAAFNATVLSYKTSLDLGLSTDTGAITEPDLLRQCIEASVAEVLALA